VDQGLEIQIGIVDSLFAPLPDPGSVIGLIANSLPDCRAMAAFVW
jgi:hypothetical protein